MTTGVFDEPRVLDDLTTAQNTWPRACLTSYPAGRSVVVTRTGTADCCDIGILRLDFLDSTEMVVVSLCERHHHQAKPTRTAFTVEAVRSLIGNVAEAVILFLCFLFGRRMDPGLVPWLDGPTGPPRIGSGFHRSVAARAGLEVKTGIDLGLLPDCALLDGDGFDARLLHPSVRDLYEHTGRYHLYGLSGCS